MCRACATLGIPCTYAGPSHKRGPPKGYILALERRLHQVEALLGTIISSEDPRARGLVDDLARDQLAAHIIRRVKVGPFGPRGRLQQPFGSTKEDFLAAIMTGSVDESPTRSHFQEENLALISPDRDWQDRLQTLLTTARQSHTAHSQSQAQYAAQGAYALPSLRQLASPTATPPQQQQPLLGGPVAFPAKLESPSAPSALLAPLGPAYAASTGGYGRMSWPADGYSSGNTLQRSAYANTNGTAARVGAPVEDWSPRAWRGADADEGLLRAGEADVKSNYELAAAPQAQAQVQAQRDYRGIQRAQQNSTPPQWYFAQEAVS